MVRDTHFVRSSPRTVINFLLLLCISISSLHATNGIGLRDPFSFATNVPQKQQSVSPVSCKKPKTNDSVDDWQVKQTSDQTVILQNKDGAIREVLITNTKEKSD